MKVKKFIETNLKFIFTNLVVILLAILYYVVRAENDFVYLIGQFIGIYVGYFVFLFLITSVFFQKKYSHRLLIAVSTMIIISFFMFGKLGDYITVGTLKTFNNGAIKIFKTYSENIPNHELRMTDNWIIESEDWQLTDRERKKLKKYFEKNKNHLVYGDNYCFFILGGFLDNASGYAYKISDSEEMPKSFGLRISYTQKVSENWIYFETN